MTDETTAQFTSRIAECSATDEGYVVHGVALGEDDITNGAYGLKKWPRAVLEPAAETLAGNEVTHLYDDPKNHGGDVIGEVTTAAYEPGVGIVYEARLADEDVANKLALGQYEVSVEGGNPDRIDHDEETGAAILHGIEFSGLAVVERGASPSNHAGAGSAADNPAIAALSAADIQAALADDDSSSEDSAADGQDSETDDTPDEPAEPGATPDSDMTDEPDDPETEGSTDEVVALREELTDVKATLSDTRERLDDVETERDHLREEREAVALAYAEALTTEESVFSAEEMAERFEVAELRERFEERDDVELAETDDEPDVQTGGGEDVDETQTALTDLSSDEREAVASLAARAQTFDDIDPDHAATLREEAASLVGADAFDDIDTEAL